MDDGTVERDMTVLIAGTVAAIDITCAESQEALNTSGRSAVEEFLDREDPPSVVVITRDGVPEQ